MRAKLSSARRASMPRGVHGTSKVSGASTMYRATRATKGSRGSRASTAEPKSTTSTATGTGAVMGTTGGIAIAIARTGTV